MNAPRTKWIFLLALLTLFMGVCTCLADTPSPEAVAKWQHLSDSEKAALRKRYKAWQSLSDTQKQALRQKVRAFKALPPEQRQRIRKNFERFKSLPPFFRNIVIQFLHMFNVISSNANYFHFLCF